MRHITSVHHDPVQVRQNWLCHVTMTQLRCDKITSVHHDPTLVRQKGLHHVTMTQLRCDKICQLIMTQFGCNKIHHIRSPRPNLGLTRQIMSAHHETIQVPEDITSAHHDPTWVWQDRYSGIYLQIYNKTFYIISPWPNSGVTRHYVTLPWPNLGVTRQILVYLSHKIDYISSPWPNSGVTKQITSSHHDPTQV